jgi:hypothetical protein
MPGLQVPARLPPGYAHYHKIFWRFTMTETLIAISIICFFTGMYWSWRTE